LQSKAIDDNKLHTIHVANKMLLYRLLRNYTEFLANLDKFRQMWNRCWKICDVDDCREDAIALNSQSSYDLSERDRQEIKLHSRVWRASQSRKLRWRTRLRRRRSRRDVHPGCYRHRSLEVFGGGVSTFDTFRM